MDDFDYIDQAGPSRNIPAVVWNILTILVLILVLFVAGVFLLIFINPNTGLNPFPPPTLPAAIALPTLTPTPRGVLPATWTPEPTLEPSQTPTPRPTATALPTETPFSLFPDTATPTETQLPGSMPFDVAQGSPAAIASTTFHPEAACNWMGVAGQVLNLSGAPVSTGIIIKLGGVLSGKFIDLTSLTGTARQYGEAGYEIMLADKPAASNGTLWVQLVDQAGLPLSDRIYFDTYDDCNKNLIFINFKQTR
jgi:hypothetical protein